MKIKEEASLAPSLSGPSTTFTQLKPADIKTISDLVDTSLKSTDVKTIHTNLQAIQKFLKVGA